MVEIIEGTDSAEVISATEGCAVVKLDGNMTLNELSKMQVELLKNGFTFDVNAQCKRMVVFS